ncbi:unnamed protein product [marine sediment metagenome]|uniref:HEPN domain-containing protein n=1 Tax=marine sediment metagenome TaxID=412755 RepID=X1HKM7_9ZZZZ
MIDPEQVNERLTFAKQRLEELEKINIKYGDLAGAEGAYKQQLIQEFFFHIVSAIDFLAQLVNDSKNLGINIEYVTVREVCKQLPSGDKIRILLENLHPETKGKNLPQDPYSEEGSHFRIILMRNIVCHQDMVGFSILVIVPGPPKTRLFIDPKYPNKGGSKKLVVDELNEFWDLVNDKCHKVLKLL